MFIKKIEYFLKKIRGKKKEHANFNKLDWWQGDGNLGMPFQWKGYKNLSWCNKDYN